MRPAPAPEQIPARSPSTSVRPPEPLGRAGVVAVLVLLGAAAALGVVLFGVGGCADRLAGAKTASTLCNVVEAGASTAAYEWERDKEAPIVAKAVQTGNADEGHAALQAQRAQLDPITVGLDGLDVVCSSLGAAVKIAAQTNGDVPQAVVDAVAPQVGKVLRLLIDAGVKLPPALLQLLHAVGLA